MHRTIASFGSIAGLAALSFAVGVSTGQAQPDHKYAGAIGGSLDLGDGVRIGGLLSMFHERESSFYNDGVSDSWWVETPGAPMTPQYSQGSPLSGDFKTALYDITQGKQSVQWGELAALGVQSENHYVGVLQLYTRIAEDTGTLPAVA